MFATSGNISAQSKKVNLALLVAASSRALTFN